MLSKQIVALELQEAIGQLALMVLKHLGHHHLFVVVADPAWD